MVIEPSGRDNVSIGVLNSFISFISIWSSDSIWGFCSIFSSVRKPKQFRHLIVKKG